MFGSILIVARAFPRLIFIHSSGDFYHLASIYLLFNGSFSVGRFHPSLEKDASAFVDVNRYTASPSQIASKWEVGQLTSL